MDPDQLALALEDLEQELAGAEVRLATPAQKAATAAKPGWSTDICKAASMSCCPGPMRRRLSPKPPDQRPIANATHDVVPRRRLRNNIGNYPCGPRASALPPMAIADHPAKMWATQRKTPPTRGLAAFFD
jgi:hypothetical protein